MKRFLLIAASLMTACAAFSTGIDTLRRPDTICISIPQAIKLLRTSDSLKIMKVELDSTNKLVQVQQGRLKSKDSTIADYKSAEVQSKQLIETFKLDKLNLQEQNKLQREDTKFFKDLYRKSTNTAWLASFSGIIVTIATYFIFRK